MSQFWHELERRGGLYAAFGWYLRWRADLLPAHVLAESRPMRPDAPALPASALRAVLSAELGEPGRRIADGLGPEPCWSTLWRCAYRSRFEDRDIVVQVPREPLADAAFDSLEGTLRRLADGPLRAAVTPDVFRQFRAWARLADAPGRERAYLDALCAEHERTTVRFPEPLPALCTARVLCWPCVDGTPLAERTGPNGEDVDGLAAGVLECLALLSVVDGDFDLEALVLDAGGNLIFRRATRMLTVPPSKSRTQFRYLSAVMARGATAAAELLVSLAGPRFRGLENDLSTGLATLAPELKVRIRLPKSAEAFEDHWRALAALGPARPLHVDLMHRNLVALGYYAAAAVPSASDNDRIEEVYGAVLGRILRRRVSEAGGPDAEADWAANGTLVAAEGLRHLNRAAEEFRDHGPAPALAFESGGGAHTSMDDRLVAEALRRAMSAFVLLGVVTACWRWGTALPAPGPAVAGVAAVVAALGMFLIVSRIE